MQTIMELPDIPFNKAEYIETASGNRVSRASVLCGSQNIILNGKNIVQSEAIIRSGELPHPSTGHHVDLKDCHGATAMAMAVAWLCSKRLLTLLSAGETLPT